MSAVNIIGFVLLFSFYIILFLKPFVQKKVPIETNYLGKGQKSVKTMAIEIFIVCFTGTGFIAQLISLFISQFQPPMFVVYGSIFIAFIGICFLLSSMSAMRNRWKTGIDTIHRTNLAVDGIYKYSRNPAFLGFDLFYIGMTIAFPNSLNILITICMIITLHLQILEEEKHLAYSVGKNYLTYKKSTSRYISLPSKN